MFVSYDEGVYCLSVMMRGCIVCQLYEWETNMLEENITFFKQPMLLVYYCIEVVKTSLELAAETTIHLAGQCEF